MTNLEARRRGPRECMARRRIELSHLRAAHFGATGLISLRLKRLQSIQGAPAADCDEIERLIVHAERLQILIARREDELYAA